MKTNCCSARSVTARRARLPRLLKMAGRLTFLAMLASVFTLTIFRAKAQPVLTPASISVNNYKASGCYSNTIGYEYRTGNYIVNWTAGQGGTSFAYSLHALPTFTNAAPYVIYEPWKIDFTDSLTVWPPTGTGTNQTITGFLGINPQIPTTVTNYFLVPGPPGSSPPYYYVTNIFLIPPVPPVTNFTTGWEQPNPPPPWPHYTDIVSSFYMFGGGQTGISTNSANVAVDLYTGRSYNTEALGRTNKFTLLSVSASGVGSNFAAAAIACTNISVLGKELNADYCAFVKRAPGIWVDATPTITNPSNFIYTVGVGGHKIVRLSRAYHYRFGTNIGGPPLIDGLRGNFEAGAELLSKDHDAKIPDNHPSLSDPNLYNSDDVPLYVEFEIIDGTPQLPSNLPIFPEQFQVDYNGTEYFNITDEKKAFKLIAVGTANILQVGSIAPSLNALAWGQCPGGTMLIVGNGDPSTLMHEWGHLTGLQHRGEAFTNYMSIVINGITNTTPVITVPNPGPYATAIMGGPNSPASAVSINRREKNTMNASNISVR